jgi:hypothetical protein
MPTRRWMIDGDDPVYPFWALMMLAADILVIYGPAMCAGRRLRA